MEKSLQKLLRGLFAFQTKCHSHDKDLMDVLSTEGQKPEVMIVSCCDSRVDPAILLQCKPGDLFVVRNVANIIPPLRHDVQCHSTSAALEFAVCFLNIKHLIILGHSQCGGIEAFLNKNQLWPNDFISNWVSLTQLKRDAFVDVDSCAKASLNRSYNNCRTYPWIRERLDNNTLTIHRWFFNIKELEIFAYSDEENEYKRLKIN